MNVPESSQIFNFSFLGSYFTLQWGRHCSYLFRLNKGPGFPRKEDLRPLHERIEDPAGVKMGGGRVDRRVKVSSDLDLTLRRHRRHSLTFPSHPAPC